MTYKISAIFALLLVSCTAPAPITAPVATPQSTPSETPSHTCDNASQQLQTMRDADQDIRKNFQSMTPADMEKMAALDLEHQQKTQALLDQNCLQSAKDYANAALIFQHGRKPEDFLQAHKLALRAVALGDPSQERLAALAIDRYLVNTGYKQLFASQAAKPNGSECWCLQDVEMDFDDKERTRVTQRNLAESEKWVQSLNGDTKCPSPYCPDKLKPVPKGAYPGVW